MRVVYSPELLDAPPLRGRGRSAPWTIGEASALIIIARLVNFFRVRACARARARLCRQEVGGPKGCAEAASADSASARAEVEVAHLHHRVPQSAAAAAGAKRTKGSKGPVWCRQRENIGFLTAVNEENKKAATWNLPRQ